MKHFSLKYAVYCLPKAVKSFALSAFSREENNVYITIITHYYYSNWFFLFTLFKCYIVIHCRLFNDN